MSKKQMDLFEIPAELPKPEKKRLPRKPRELTPKERAEEAREKRQREKEEKLRAQEAAKAERPTLDQIEKELSRARRQRRVLKLWQNALLVLLALLALCLLAGLIFPVARVQGTDMADTLSEGDLIAAVRTQDVRRGDIVLFSAGGEQLLVRRVIALSGDEVDISSEGIVAVNGDVIAEAYVPQTLRGECETQFPCTVPEGRLFVLSDDRSSTTDSRFDFPGLIAEEQLIGRVAVRLLPIESAGSLMGE